MAHAEFAKTIAREMAPSPQNLDQGFALGPWTVEPQRCLIRRDGKRTHLEPKVMEVLLALARHQGSVVSKNDLVDQVWDGRSASDDAIAAKIGTLRRSLGDDSKNPTFIETVQKRGYRLRASVELREMDDFASSPPFVGKRIAVAIAAIVLVGAGVWFGAIDNATIDSIAVLPFKNLSAESDQYQYAADGFAEELVVSLGKVPNVQVARGPRSLDEVNAAGIARGPWCRCHCIGQPAH